MSRAFLHVGLQKTGTSYLQSHLWDSPRELAEQGVRMVPPDRTRAFHLTQGLTTPEGEELASGPARALDALREEVASAEEPTLIVSQEALGGASAEQAARLREVFEGREVHVVATARDIARQLPSAWQQRIKSGGRIGLEEYVDSVRERRPNVAGFWLHHDLVAVLDRWTDGLPPDHVHVVTAPPAGSPSELLAERFGSVVGVDFARLHADDLRANVSLDPVQVEMLRRLNLRGRVFERRGAHARMIKQVLAGKILAPRRTGSLYTPPAAAQWCLEHAEAQVAAIRERGWTVTGNLDDLVPGPGSYGSGEPVTDEQVLDVALETVGELLRRLDRAQKRASQTADGTAARRPGEKSPRRFRRRPG